MSAIANVIPLERIEHSTLLIRGHKVMLSIELQISTQSSRAL